VTVGERLRAEEIDIIQRQGSQVLFCLSAKAVSKNLLQNHSKKTYRVFPVSCAFISEGFHVT
jgi:hypothetical protein